MHPIALFVSIVVTANTGVLYCIGAGIILQLLFILLFYSSKVFKEIRPLIWELQTVFYGIGAILGSSFWSYSRGFKYSFFETYVVLVVVFVYLICAHVLLILTVYFKKL